MPDQDWQNLYQIICDQVAPRYGIECVEEAGFLLLKAPGITTMIFDTVTIQIDNTVYEVPWNRWFDRMFDDTLYMTNFSIGDKMTLGMTFLSAYY